MRPMGGEKLGPDWMRGNFDTLDTFYLFFLELIESFKNTG